MEGMENVNMAPAAAAGGAAIIMLIVELAILLLILIGMWKAFAKAGKPGWAAIVPIYNIVIMLQIAGKPLWWILMFFIPFVNLIFAIMTLAGFAKAYGKGGGTVVGLIFLPFIFWPMLGFGSAQYQGPVEEVPASEPQAAPPAE